MSGRGDLLSLFNKKTEASVISSSTDGHAKDSGLDVEQSISSGEYHQLARENIANEVSKAFQIMNVSFGRGRAQLLQNFQNDQHQLGGEILKQSSKISNSSATQLQNLALEGASDKFDLFHPNVVHGKKGSDINLACNYVSVKSDPSKGVFLYEVRFFPTVDSIHLRIKYLNEHKEKIGGTKTFDGTILYLPILLEDKITKLVCKNADNLDIEIRILFKKKESVKNCSQVYNILFDRVMKTLNYVRFDRKQYDPSRPKIIPLAKLEVWPGYVMSVDEYEGGLMLCCDVSHRILCQRTVLDILIEIYQHNKNHYQEIAKKSLIGSVVITRYNNRTYRIDDIAFDQNPLSVFNTRTGSISYMEYYKTHHYINIKDLKQPLLLSTKKSRGNESQQAKDIRFCLIPELCYLTGLSDEIRADHKLMREIATFTRVSPNQRMVALNNFCENVSQSIEARKVLENWGLSLINNYNELIGRQLGQEQIYFAKKSVSAGTKGDFSKDAMNSEMLKIVHLKNWIIIHFKNDLRAVKALLENMDRCCKSFGMNVLKPKIISLDHDRLDSYVDALRRNICIETQIAVCICPNSRDDRYSAIKKICCSEVPVPSQVINARTLSIETKNRSIVQKIILQMNCKMGGSLWTVKIPFKNVMICGIDSYHDSSQKKNSVAALVASLNSSYTQWYSKAVVQTKREEIVNGLTASFETALNTYKKLNGQLPETVIIYRDGIGDGQLNLCTNYEIPQFKAVFGDRVNITFIIVQKRINTRFYLRNGPNFDNPLPGTVVDKYITRNHMYDFFLVSQNVRQGTVTPTHYVVLKDDVNFGPDIIQKLSYKLCFLYYNWPGTVRIPACCMYAHKMAYLIGQSIQRDVADVLSEKLFYL